MVISTNGGLWRYRLEDTVEFTSKNPFKIKVVGRTQQFINIAGEEVMIQHIEKALEGRPYTIRVKKVFDFI